MSSSQSLTSFVGDTHNAMHSKNPQKTEENGKRIKNEEKKQKRTCESYISHFVPRDSGWWEEGNQIETEKNNKQISK